MNEARAEGEISSVPSPVRGSPVSCRLVPRGARRPGRPRRATLRELCTRLPLPDEGMSLIVPRGTTGASAAAQATREHRQSSTDEVGGPTSPCRSTLQASRHLPASVGTRRTRHRPTRLRDLAGAVAAEIDRQILVGTGASNQALGLLSTSGIYQATAFSAAATATTFWSNWPVQ